MNWTSEGVQVTTSFNIVTKETRLMDSIHNIRLVLELGAGCALPSLLASTFPIYRAPRLVVVIDYPDPVILDNLQKNVDANSRLIRCHQKEARSQENHRENERCELMCRSYSWGLDATSLLYVLSTVMNPKHFTKVGFFQKSLATIIVSFTISHFSRIFSILTLQMMHLTI